MDKPEVHSYQRLIRFALDHPVWAVVIGSLFVTLVILVAMVVLPVQKEVPSEFMYIRF